MQSVNWDQFLVPYQIAVDELKVKLKAVRKQFKSQNDHSPIEFVTGRVKPVGSILEKAKRKNIADHELATDMQDIAGLRIMCQFVDDIVHVLDLLHRRTDFKIVEERNYIPIRKTRAIDRIMSSSSTRFRRFTVKSLRSLKCKSARLR